MRRRYLVLLVMAGLVVIAATSVRLVIASGHKTGPLPETPPPAAYLHLVPKTPESTPASTSCGPWSDASISTSSAAAISQKHGELRNCMLFDNSWIITTLGLKGQSGIVAVYRCDPADSTCLNGQTDHPLAGWRFIAPPCPGQLSIVGEDGSTGRLRVFGTCATWFDVATETFIK